MGYWSGGGPFCRRMLCWTLAGSGSHLPDPIYHDRYDFSVLKLAFNPTVSCLYASKIRSKQGEGWSWLSPTRMLASKTGTRGLKVSEVIAANPHTFHVA